MKVSYNWLKTLIDTDKSPEELSLVLTDIGLEVESLTKVQSIPGGLDGLVIGEVLTCVQHPNADRLRLTTVTIGQGNPLSIVCGAPNVAVGQKVVVATVGTWVHPIEGEAFEIKKSKIRGEISEGMLCAEDEIGIGSGHEGILVLPEETPVGMSAKSYFKVEDDYVFVIGLTPNRVDAASHLGVARDLAAALKTNFSFPTVNSIAENSGVGRIQVAVKDAELCPRYSSVTISGVKVKESPQWLLERLKAIGLRPINNIVDITNFVLHELGQPLHAFDADKISGNKIVVQTVPAGTPFTTLDGVERTLNEEDLMICDEKEPLCIAGVFGGMDSGVSETTTNIFLESAYFNAVSVRKTAKRHGLNTDASFRFERGTDPEMTVLALQRAVYLIQEVAGFEDVSALADFYPTPVLPFSFKVSYSRINQVIGAKIDKEEVHSILKGLDISIKEDDGEQMLVEVPAYRVDVTREIDIIEEVLRLYGYNRVEIGSQMKVSLTPSAKPNKETIQNTVAETLVAKGFHEILNNSLTKGKYALDEERVVKILNPLSTDLNIMRQSMLHSGLETISYNQKRKHPNLRLFEFGKTYFKDQDAYVENGRLSLLMTGRKETEQWNHDTKFVSFYELKGMVDALLKRLGIHGFQVSELQDSLFQYGLKYGRGAQELVSFGEVSQKLQKTMDVSGKVFFADFNWDALLKALKNHKITYKELSKFPSVRRDLSLLVDQTVSFASLEKIARKTDKKLLKEVNVFDVYQGDKLPENKKSYALSFVFQDEEKTLTDKQIDALVQKLIVNFGKEANAEVRN